ncbi:hypothetical protein KCM76_06100 [Zooshikella marina]|uniref:hypothetical protein n=1 Tax=Zooshikella ganghwensis TaxID=202772 RepID=UPI0004108196|nr:hypothetical protein [Zooshikella ganghwensis]MBU2705543.1 hypothetical protein [Zooshikella ganghwensis]
MTKLKPSREKTEALIHDLESIKSLLDDEQPTFPHTSAAPAFNLVSANAEIDNLNHASEKDNSGETDLFFVSESLVFDDDGASVQRYDDNIPILEDIAETNYQADQQKTPELQEIPTLNGSINPFLPAETLDKLSSPKSTSLQQEAEQHKQAIFTEVSQAESLNQAKKNKLKRALELESELILQEIIDEYIPQIEAEFHKRLRSQIQQIVNRFMDN